MYDLILANLSKFIQLTGDEKQLFISKLKHRKFRKKQYVLQVGDIARHENFVIKGLLRAYALDDKGQERIAMFAMEDWWISDMYSFLTETPATQNIDALEDTEVLSIEKPDLENLYVEVPKFERFFRIIIQNAFIAGQKRILSSISESAEQQYNAFIKKYPSLEQRIPQNQIASFLGITPETISRIRKQK
jgi:CRP-like cAMP-binding protein